MTDCGDLPRTYRFISDAPRFTFLADSRISGWYAQLYAYCWMTQTLAGLKARSLLYAAIRT
jgi:hypothetical protein